VFINPEVGAALAGGPLAQQRISSADKGRRRNDHNFRVVGSVAVAVCLPTRRDIDEPTSIVRRIAEEIVKTGATADQRSRDQPGRHTGNSAQKRVTLLFFISGMPTVVRERQALTCPKSCPKNGDVPKSLFLPIGSHSAHRLAQFQISTLVRTAVAIDARSIRVPMARAPWPQDPLTASIEEERRMQVFVRDNNVDQALKVLKKKMQREGVFREMKLRGHYEKPSERKVREKAEAIRRARKLARKKLQREGLLPMKPRVIPGAPARSGPARTPRF
jgi:small subunit ribosomal protein S21